MKTFWQKFKKWIIALIFGSVVMAAGLVLQPDQIPCVIVDDQKICFFYTDENSNENLIIYTDQEVYTPLWAWNGFDVYVAVENKSGKSQTVSFQSFFLKDFSIEEVSILNPTATTTIKEPIYKDVCQEMATTSSKDTTTVCYQEKIGEKDKIVLGVWNTIPQQQFSKEAYDKTISDNKIQVKQKVGDKVAGYFTDYSLKNQFSYYKLRIKSNEPFSKEEFFIEAIGQNGAYGMLDPTIFTDDFNSYNDGDLNGQGGWTAGAAIDVQGVTTFEGTKAVRTDLTNSLDVDSYKTGTATADGRITFYYRFTNATYNYAAIRVRVAGQASGSNHRFNQAAFQLQDGASTFYNVATGLAIDTWHCVEIEWRSADWYHRARVNEGTWTDWYSSFLAANPDQFKFNPYGNGGSYTSYLDYIAENPISVAEEPQMSVIIIE